jgi:hypothetical protein
MQAVTIRAQNALLCRGSVARVLGTLLAVCWLASGARSQLPANTRPDVYVVVMAHPSGQWAVSAVYPKVVPTERMRAHLKRLLLVSGWSGGGVEYETRGIPKNNGDFSKVPRGGRLNHENLSPGGAGPAMSSVTFLTRSSVVNWKNATLPVEPFARAFRDLKRVYVTFFVPGSFAFRGLREHSDANLDVALSAEGGAYTYALNIKNHSLEKLNLPQTQVVPPEADVRTASSAGRQAEERLRLVGTTLVVLLATLAGLFVYSWAHRWGGR